MKQKKKEILKVVLGILVFSEKPDVCLLLRKRTASADQSILSEVSLHFRRYYLVTALVDMDKKLLTAT